MPRSDWLFLGSDWMETRGGQETSMRYGGTIWVTSETQPHFIKRPGSRNMAAASVVSMLLVATERNQWQSFQSPLLLLPLPLLRQRIGSGSQFGRKAVALNIEEKKKILCDTEPFYHTTLEEMPMNVDDLI
ncbi:hypothetical protein DBR06_SOUSAS18010039 [Sousa chinensis]|uniref:Uncharacterized protein n=1 Tax=Sousa chinensis TaxID=103600 RepID=A0A484H0H2_SOUCH|nr:hypothetical protein DBR06_SOUSAS18010039 [Sousa chinensis]